MGVGFIGLCNIGGRCARNVLAAVTSRRLLPSTIPSARGSWAPVPAQRRTRTNRLSGLKPCRLSSAA